jgi:hypothetical protein
VLSPGTLADVAQKVRDLPWFASVFYWPSHNVTDRTSPVSLVSQQNDGHQIGNVRDRRSVPRPSLTTRQMVAKLQAIETWLIFPQAGFGD